MRGFASNKWEQIKASVQNIFVKSKEDADGVGGEAAVPLAAYAIGIKLCMSKMEKKYEHPINLDEEQIRRFKLGRIKQFESGSKVILEFARKISPDKVEFLTSFSKEAVEEIMNADFHWNGKLKSSEWNENVNTTF